MNNNLISDAEEFESFLMYMNPSDDDACSSKRMQMSSSAILLSSSSVTNSAFKSSQSDKDHSPADHSSYQNNINEDDREIQPESVDILLENELICASEIANIDIDNSGTNKNKTKSDTDDKIDLNNPHNYDSSIYCSVASSTTVLMDNDDDHKQSSQHSIDTLYRSRIATAIFAYYHHQYLCYAPDPSNSSESLSLKADIKLASHIPNRLQEEFQDRLVFLMNEHGYLLTKDALTRPADREDEDWQQMLRLQSDHIYKEQQHLATGKATAFGGENNREDELDDAEDDEDEDEFSLKQELEEEKEEETNTFRSVMAQGTGAYVFTTLLPTTMGLSSAVALSFPALTIAAVVGAVAGQVAWETFQQQKLLYPPQHYSALHHPTPNNHATSTNTINSSSHGCDSVSNEKYNYHSEYNNNESSGTNTSSAVSLTQALPHPPKYRPALRRWRRCIYHALATSKQAKQVQDATIQVFLTHWLSQYHQQHAPVSKNSANDHAYTSINTNSSSVHNKKDNKLRLVDKEDDDDDWEVIQDMKCPVSPLPSYDVTNNIMTNKQKIDTSNSTAKKMQGYY